MFKLLTKRSFSLGLMAVAVAVVTGCGGGSSGSVATPTPTATTLLSVTPVLGAVYGGTVNVYSSTGTLLGTATTSNTDGKASVSLSNYTAGSPVIIKVSLGAGASYFNEKTGINVNVTAANPISLLSALPTVGTGQSVGVTPITNMAAKLAGLTPNAVGSGTLATTVTADSIYTAVAKTNLALPTFWQHQLPPLLRLLSQQSRLGKFWLSWPRIQLRQTQLLRQLPWQLQSKLTVLLT